MSDVSSKEKDNFFGERFFEPAVSFGIAATVFALAVYGYLGTFSRYGSDDYCLSAFYFLEGDFLTLMIQRYLSASSRYTNILFIGLADKLFGWYNVAILPALMLALFVWGLYLFLKESAQTASLGWGRRFCLLLAAWIVYFSVLQAPNLYQTLFWRAGMTTHFAPLVFIPFLGAFLLRQIRNASPTIPLWIRFFCLLSSFVLGGFSEPPTALMITALVLAILAVWRWGSIHSRAAALPILTWTLAGALLSLTVLALAPANSLRLGATPSLIQLLLKTFRYPFEFMMDNIRSLIIPTFISIALPGLLFSMWYSRASQTLTREARIRLGILFVIALGVGYLLIAASFAPSIYGQSYPSARARFAGRVILTCIFMMSGAFLGVLLTNVGKATVFRLAALAAFTILACYPLRTAWRVSADIPSYQRYAEAWDRRDAQIRTLKAQGVQDLIVPFLPEEVTQDLGDKAEFRLNVCAARLYGVNSILAISMDE